jgi:hypothetical protein
VSHILIDRLIDELGYERVTLDNHDEFVAADGMNVLFFPGDPATLQSYCRNWSPHSRGSSGRESSRTRSGMARR